MRYHVCFGSWHVPHVADAPLGAIVDLMLRARPLEAGERIIAAAALLPVLVWIGLNV